MSSPQQRVADRRVNRIVDPGTMVVTDDRTALLQTPPLGSAVAVALYDPEVGLGGLLHLLLPDSTLDVGRGAERPALFADSGFEALLAQMEARGAERGRLKCYLVGGSDPTYRSLSEPAVLVGQRNAEAARGLLERAGLALTADRTGGSRARRVVLDVATGVVRITETPPERRTDEPRR